MKRTLAILCVLVMLFTLSVGCTPNNADATDDSDQVGNLIVVGFLLKAAALGGFLAGEVVGEGRGGAVLHDLSIPLPV